MNIQDLVLRVRQDFLDDYNWNKNLDWLTQDRDRFWTNKSIIKALEEARKEFRLRVPARDSTTTSIVQYSILAGQNPSITYDDRILRINWARIASEDKNLTKRYINNQLNDHNPEYRIDNTDPPEEYVEDLGDYTLTLIGNLAANDTIEISVDRLAIEKITGWPIEKPWLATTAYVLPDVVHPVDQTANNHWYEVTVAGTSGATEPVFPTDGTTVVDGTVTWLDKGELGDYEVTDIPDREETSIIFWMLHLLYLKRDPDMGDSAGSNFGINLSQHFGNKFTAMVGPAKSSVSQQKTRTRTNVLGTRSHY